MKLLILFLLLGAGLLLTGCRHVVDEQAIYPSISTRIVLSEMTTVSDGVYRLNLELDKGSHIARIKVLNNQAVCTASDAPRVEGATGSFEPIGNGIFTIFFQNGNGRDYRATQHWFFREDGSAIVKEVPDEGQKQRAILEVPGLTQSR